jgi:hypothetical protein
VGCIQPRLVSLGHNTGQDCTAPGFQALHSPQVVQETKCSVLRCCVRNILCFSPAVGTLDTSAGPDPPIASSRLRSPADALPRGLRISGSNAPSEAQQQNQIRAKVWRYTSLPVQFVVPRRSRSCAISLCPRVLMRGTLRVCGCKD